MGYGMTGKLCRKGFAKEYDVDNICFILSFVQNTRTCDKRRDHVNLSKQEIIILNNDYIIYKSVLDIDVF